MKRNPKSIFTGLRTLSIAKCIAFLQQDGRWNMRKRAAFCLNEKKDPDAIEALITALKDENFYVRETAESSLINTGKYVLPYLIAYLKSEDSDLLYRIARVLGGIRDSRALEPLFTLLKNKDSWVRMGAAQGLGWVHDNSAIELLIKCATEDRDKWVSAQATSSLGQYENNRTIDALIDLLEDEAMEVRVEAAAALKNFGEEAIGPLISYIRDRNTPWGARILAVGALKAMGYKPQTKEIKIAFSIFENDFCSLVKCGKEGVQSLAAFFKEKPSAWGFSEHMWDLSFKRLEKMSMRKSWRNSAVELLSAIVKYGESNSFTQTLARHILKKIGCEPVEIEKPIAPARSKTRQRNYISNFDLPYSPIALPLFLDGLKEEDLKKYLFTKEEWQLCSIPQKKLERPKDEYEMGIEDKVYNYIQRRQGQKLREIWDQTRFVLLSHLRSYPYVSVFALIALGKEDTIPDLINILKERKDINIAQLFLNCGNPELQKTVQKWALSHGLIVKRMTGTPHLYYNSW